MDEQMKIIRVEASQINSVVPLFNAYRQFYGKKSDLKSAHKFLFERLSNNESVLFAAVDDEKIVGFVQLYPLFSSLGMKRVWVLNDLYVTENYRQKGVARKLVGQVHTFAAKSGAGSVVLETAPDNTKAQGLYQKLGYKKNTMEHYWFDLK